MCGPQPTRLSSSSILDPKTDHPTSKQKCFALLTCEHVNGHGKTRPKKNEKNFQFFPKLTCIRAKIEDFCRKTRLKIDDFAETFEARPLQPKTGNFPVLKLKKPPWNRQAKWPSQKISPLSEAPQLKAKNCFTLQFSTNFLPKIWLKLRKQSQFGQKWPF